MSTYKLNFEQAGNAIAIIKSDKKATAKKYTPLVYIGEARNGFEEIKLDKNEHFIPIPDITVERSVNYIFGQSGSGKSYWVTQYAKQYKSFFPKRQIFVFSSLETDKEGLDKIGKINRINLNSDFINGESIPIEEFENSLVIFDDVDSLEKKTRDCVWSYMNKMLQTGRHHKISMCITMHTSCNGAQTKLILNEAHTITYFPVSCGGRNLKYILESYLSMDKPQQARIKKIDSRWITVVKSYPKVILSDHDCYVLRND